MTSEAWALFLAATGISLLMEVVSLVVILIAIRMILWPRFKRWLKERGVE